MFCIVSVDRETGSYLRVRTYGLTSGSEVITTKRLGTAVAS